MSDIHGNLPAMEIVINRTKHVDLYISLGDVINYGPWSNECVELFDTIQNKILLKGNHEENFLANNYPGSNEIAKEFHIHCIKTFNRFDIIADYLQEYTIDNFLLKHTLDNRYIFDDSEINLTQNTIIGHSHKQYIVKKGDYKLINPGSVGQNRKHINLINYMIWNTKTNIFQQFKIVYNVDAVINKMKQLKYPEICINYYENKVRYE